MLLTCLFWATAFRRLLKPTAQTYSMTLIIQSQFQTHSHDPTVRIMHLYKQCGWVTPRLKIPQLIWFDDQQNLLNCATYNRYIEAVSPYARPGRLWARWKVRGIQSVTAHCDNFITNKGVCYRYKPFCRGTVRCYRSKCTASGYLPSLRKHPKVEWGVFRRVRKIAKTSVRPSACNNSAPTGRIFMKFDIWVFFENLSREFKSH
jgi:hypothetical protein